MLPHVFLRAVFKKEGEKNEHRKKHRRSTPVRRKMGNRMDAGHDVTDCTGAYTEKWNSAPREALVGTVSEKTMDPDIAGADIVDGISEAFLMCRTPEAAAAVDRCVQAFTGLSAENLAEEAEKRAAENRENG